MINYLLFTCYYIIFNYICIMVYETETEHSKKVKDRNANIIKAWTENYQPVATQITPLAESIAKEHGVSISTVKRLVKNLIK